MHLALLDTDTLSEVLKRKAPKVVKRAAVYLRQHGQFALSAIIRYEALRGLEELAAARQLARFHDFCNRSLVIPVNDVILDRAASLWVAGRRRGLMSRDADLIIAATALEHGRVLVTGNAAHFSWIGGLPIENSRD